MAAGEMKVLLEVGGFDIEKGVEMTMIQEHIHIQKHDFQGGDILSEFDGIVVVKEFQGTELKSCDYGRKCHR